MRARVRIAVLAGCLLALLVAPSRAPAVGLQSIGPTFDAPQFATSPPGDPRLFVVERGGTIQVVHDGTVTQFLDISDLVDTDGERGLLSMAFDPLYAGNGLFYVFYSDNGAAGGSVGDIRIEEFHVSADPNVADRSTRRTVWTFSHGATNHNGGQLQFGGDGLLYISVGDNANRANAQSLGNPYGKILRIDPHGVGPGAHGIPPTNPFAGTPGATQEVWSVGLRNPFRFSFDAVTRDLVIGDVGEVSREEVDLAPASVGGGRGANFGWPGCEGFSGSCPGATPPVFDYPHSDPGGGRAFGCAVIGGYVYRGTQAPEIAGRYLYADLCTAQLRSIQLATPLAGGDRAESGIGALSTARSFGQDSACNLYVMNTSTVFRIVGSAPTATPACTFSPAKKKKCKKRKHPKKKHRDADAKKDQKDKKKHKKKRCKKKKHKKRR